MWLSRSGVSGCRERCLNLETGLLEIGWRLVHHGLVPDDADMKGAVRQPLVLDVLLQLAEGVHHGALLSGPVLSVFALSGMAAGHWTALWSENKEAWFRETEGEKRQHVRHWREVEEGACEGGQSWRVNISDCVLGSRARSLPEASGLPVAATQRRSLCAQKGLATRRTSIWVAAVAPEVFAILRVKSRNVPWGWPQALREEVSTGRAGPGRTVTGRAGLPRSTIST